MSSEHFLGYLRITDNPRAFAEVSKTPPSGVFTFEQYLEACRRKETLKNKRLREERELYTKGHLIQNLLSPAERTFSEGSHSPDVEGYVRYRIALDPDFAEVINETVAVYIPEKARLAHTFIAGSPGGGKTELFKILIYSYVKNPGLAAVVALDPHGDYSRQIACWKEFAGDPRLVYFHARLYPGYLPCINPLELPETAGLWERRQTAQQLASAFQEILGGGEGSDMSVQMETLLINCILVLLDYPNATLRHLRRLLRNDEELVRFAKSCHHYPDAVEYFEHDFFRNKTIESTKGSVSTKLGKIFASGIFAELTCHKSTINLEREIDRKRVLVFNLAGIGDIEGPAFGRMLMATLQAIAKRRDQLPEHRRTVTHVFADEIQTLATPSLGVILGEHRKHKMILTMAQPIIGMGMSAELRKIVTGAPNCKIAAYCEPTERSEAARLLNCEPELLGQLGEGEFIIRMREQAPFRFRARRDLARFRHSMYPSVWNMVRLRQREEYYRKQAAQEPAPTTDIEPEDTNAPIPTDEDDRPQP